ncbi:Hypothetical protein A7982_03685 [Minicystis rosea]|nr:Hypothetical protein A7982_03685 [Minicystis rosea]
MLELQKGRRRQARHDGERGSASGADALGARHGHPEEPVDAGTDAGDAGLDAGKPGGGSAAGSIAKCCAALQQNANSAPLDQKPYYMAAANACNGMRNTPSAQQAFAQLRMFLAGAKMPGACK